MLRASKQARGRVGDGLSGGMRRMYQEHPHAPEQLADGRMPKIGETTQLQEHDGSKHGEFVTEDRLDPERPHDLG